MTYVPETFNQPSPDQHAEHSDFFQKTVEKRPSALAQNFFHAEPVWAVAVTEYLKAARRPGDILQDICTEICQVAAMASIFRPTAFPLPAKDPRALGAILSTIINEAPAGSILVFKDDPREHKVIPPEETAEFGKTYKPLTGHPQRFAKITPNTIGHEEILTWRDTSGSAPRFDNNFVTFCQNKAIKLPNGIYHFLGDPLAAQYLRLTNGSDTAGITKIIAPVLEHLEMLRDAIYRSFDYMASVDCDVYDQLKALTKTPRRAASTTSKMPPKEHLTARLSATRKKLASRSWYRNARLLKQATSMGASLVGDIGRSRAAAYLRSNIEKIPATFFQKLRNELFREEYEEALTLIAEENPEIDNLVLPWNNVDHAGVEKDCSYDMEHVVPRIVSYIENAATIKHASDGRRHVSYAQFHDLNPHTGLVTTNHYLTLDEAEEFIIVCWTTIRAEVCNVSESASTMSLH